MGLPVIKEDFEIGGKQPAKPELRLVKNTKRTLKHTLDLPNDLGIALNKDGQGETIGFKLSNEKFEYNIDVYSMPYCMDKESGNCFGISNTELQGLFDLAKTQVDAEGKIFLMRNQKNILQNNSQPKDVFLKDRLFGYVVNFEGVLFWIETKGTGQYFVIRVDKEDSTQQEIPKDTRQKILEKINTSLDVLSPEGRKYWLQNEEMITAMLLDK